MSGEEVLISLVAASRSRESTSDGHSHSSSSGEGEKTRSVTTTALSACGICSLFLLMFWCILVYVGYLQVNKAKNEVEWHDAAVPPPEFPRYMGCGRCEPGVKDDATIKSCVEPCFTLEYILQWEAFAKNHDYKLVFFPSRRGPRGEPPVNISAWWLPADTSRTPPGRLPPRIVVLHGLASNCNHCGVQSACFLLRTLGFSCLTPSVRGYGLSGKSTHPATLSWGYDYPYDLLGAWDYAVKDPEGYLGGALPPEQVGIMGFSKGALSTAIAFNLEKDISGVWIDSAPFQGLQGMIDSYASPYVGHLWMPFIRFPIYWAAGFFSGTPLDYYKPIKMFKDCTPPKRQVCISHSKTDGKVPISLAAPAIFEIGGRPACYDLRLYTPAEECDGANHHVEMWQYPDQTRARFCDFWSAAFKQNHSLCGLKTLPMLDWKHLDFARLDQRTDINLSEFLS